MCIHTSPDIWKNPLQFDPDRFLPENERNRPRCSFIPFSHGLRNCIGRGDYQTYGRAATRSTTLMDNWRPVRNNREDDDGFDFSGVRVASRIFYVSNERKINSLSAFKHAMFSMKITLPIFFKQVQSTEYKSVEDVDFCIVAIPKEGCKVKLQKLEKKSLISLARYHWNRRRLYYHAWKIGGPFAWPIIGSAYLFIRGHKDSYNIVTKMINSQPPIFKLWMGTKLVILTTQPTHAEVIVKTCFNRLGTKHMEEIFKTGLITAPVDIWRRRRKIINKSFNTKILNSYVDIFDKRARHLMKQFEEKCHGNYIDLLETLLRCSLDTVCETLLDVDSNSITGQARYITNTNRLAKISAIRGSSIWLHAKFIWSYSSLHQEVTNLRREMMDFIRQIIEMKKLNIFDKEKVFINNLINSTEDGELDESGVMDEIQSIFAASETTAITNALVLCMMGLHSNIQKNIQEELASIFGHSDRTVTLEDVNRMYYLERVIKETMRLFPPVPFIRRSVDEDIELDSHVLPKGSEVYIPLLSLHRRPDFWKDPLVFNPDRFLAENEAKRPNFSYLPFSRGSKNCIGFKYAMLSMKTMLAIFFKHYEVQSTKYKSIEDVDFWLAMLLAQFLIILALILLVKYHWDRRWLYYHGSKFKGPFPWPILGNAPLFFGKDKDAYKTLTNLVNSQSPTFRVWLGRELVVVTTEPAYVETILSNSLDRFKSHNLEEIFHTGLLIAPGEYLHL
ncbi:hypothetical protein GEV33_014720 [Tenebrio molitor]|uniref:Cytochrome P450 monooxygenase n=1 Tax=Tenebrio molitor TaxID=7067 RepID=A0A8J6LCF8_TENMO|nr:hypothetical protein GEV33_014720 [Tenebrio molitor]